MNNFLNIKTLIFVLLFVLNSSVHSSTISQKSKISVYQGHNRISFFINSDITESILVDFEKLLQQYPNHVGANVYLNSPGGSVFVGLKLGYIFRSHKMRLFVGTERNGETFPGSCASACAIAYLGGHERFLNSKSRLGLHQFYVSGNNTLKANDAIAISQEVSSLLVKYWNTMGIDFKLFSVMSSTPSNYMYWLTHQDIIAYNINTLPKVLVTNTIPHLNENGIKGFQKYISFSAKYKAFAIAEDGAWGWKAMDSKEAIEIALKVCEGSNRSKKPCKLYAINDTVVWK